MTFARALFTVSGFTMISRIAGFARDTMTAMFLGAGTHADAFFVAQRLPNLFRSLFAEGAFTSAFVPLYTAEKETNGAEAAKIFAGEALALLIALLTPFIILVMLFMPWAVRLIAPGFDDEPDKFRLAVEYSSITFPYLLLISITALQSGVLNAHGRFGPGAAAPIMLNIVMILSMLVSSFFNWHVAEALSWGMLISGFVQAGWLTISCYRAGLSLRLVFPHFTGRCRQLFSNIGPGAIGAGATQINLLLNTILASMLPTGAVSYLYYADRLNQLPLGIIGIAVATTLLPILSKHEAHGDSGAVRHTVSRAIEFCLVLGLPAAIGLGFAAAPIIQTLFEHGAFTAQDTSKTAQTLVAYSPCIPAFLLAKVFAARFFALQDTRTPVKIALIAMVANVLLALLFMGWFAHVGMALATSLATWLNAGLLYTKLRQNGGSLADSTLIKRIPRLIISAAGMGALTLFMCQEMAGWFENSTIMHKVVALAVIIGLSSVLYSVLLFLTKAVNWSDIMRHFNGLNKHQETVDDA